MQVGLTSPTEGRPLFFEAAFFAKGSGVAPVTSGCTAVHGLGGGLELPPPVLFAGARNRHYPVPPTNRFSATWVSSGL